MEDDVLELRNELEEKQKYILDLEGTIIRLKAQIKRGIGISMDVERRLVAAEEEICLLKEYKKAAGIRGDYFEGLCVEQRKEIDALKDLISSAAPVTWAQTQWLDDAVAWEEKAAALLKINENKGGNDEGNT